MKDKILKNKKLLIILAILIILLVIGIVFILDRSNKENKTKPETTTTSYTAYISINPLVKVEFKRTCTITDDSFFSKCEDPVVTSTTLVNDDAREIYKDVDFANSESFADLLYVIVDRAKEYGIVFEKVDIYSDWEESEKYIEDNVEKRDDNWNYTFNITIDEELSIEKLPIENEDEYIVVFNSDGGSSVDSQTVKKGKKVLKPTNPTKESYVFVEWQLDGKAYDFDNKVTKNMELKATWKKQASSQEKTTNSTTKTTKTTKPSTTKQTTTTTKTNVNELKYDYNLNDNIFYTLYDINLMKKPTDDCLSKLKNAGYSFNRDYTIIFPFDLDSEDFKEADDANHSVLKSCVKPMEKSDINYISSIKGAKFRDVGGYTGTEQEKMFWAIWFFEDKYNDKLLFRPFYPPTGYMQVDSTGPLPEDETALLNEQTCKEYNLSCGRW